MIIFMLFALGRGTLTDAGDGDGGGKSSDLINSSRIEKTRGLDNPTGLFWNNMVSDPLKKEGLTLGDINYPCLPPTKQTNKNTEIHKYHKTDRIRKIHTTNSIKQITLHMCLGRETAVQSYSRASQTSKRFPTG